jgi:hypothetical protein
MTRLEALIVLAAVVFINGCASTDTLILDKTKRAPTTSIDIFKDGRMPERKYQAIAELSFLGPRDDELRAQRHRLG